MKTWITIISISLMNSVALGSDIKIDELTLSILSQEDSPTRQSISAMKTAGELANSKTRSAYDSRLNLGYSYSDTEEESLTSFSPEFGPSEALSLGITKTTPLGLQVGVGLFGNQLSTVDNSVIDATRAGATFSLDFDLWQNVFGRISRSQLKSAAAEETKAKLQSEIRLKQLELDVRKLYWSLVAVEESIQVSQKLLKTSQTQLRDARKKLRAGASDKGNLARNQAQVDSRKSTITQLNYQKELLLSQLRGVLPQLRQGNLVLAPVNFQSNVDSVLQCIAEISKQPKLNMKFTKWAEVLALLKDQYTNDVNAINRTGGPSLLLEYDAQVSGVDNSYGRAFDEAETDSATGHSVGVTLSIPIGSDTRTTEIKEKALKRYSYESEKQSIETDIIETHRRVLRSLKLLNEALDSRVNSNKNLVVSVREAQRKYRQARISINSLVLEQDAFLNSTLTEIEIKKLVIHTLLDYFKVFTDHSCKINNLRGA